MKPDFGQVKRIIGAFGRIFLRHNLDKHRPAGKSCLLDALIEIALVTFAVFRNDSFGLGVGQVLDALLGAEMEFHPEALVFSVDHAEGVAAEAMHVAVGIGNATVAHGDGDLVQRLRQRSPEVPVVLGAAQVGSGIAFDRMVEVGKFEGSRRKKTGVLLPTRSQLPSSV